MFNNVFHTDIFLCCFYNLEPGPRTGTGPWTLDPDPKNPEPKNLEPAKPGPEKPEP